MRPARRACVAAALLLAGCGSSLPPAALSGAAAGTATPAPGWISASNGLLLDAQGRQLMLRGFNHIALRSDARHPAYEVNGVITPDAQLFELQDLRDADFDTLAATGADALRLVVTWEFAQPDPPPAPYNEDYFDLIDAFIAKARARGMVVVFDFGQFAWGRGLGGNAGAPDWTIFSSCASLPGAPAGAPPQLSVAVGCQFLDFWENQPLPAADGGGGLQDAYIALWQFVAQRYRDEPAVAAYDLFNEPYGGAIPPGVLEPTYLYPFYQKLAAAIRAVDPNHAVAFQPEVYHSIGVPTPFAQPIGIADSLYMPHEYTQDELPQHVDPSYLGAFDTVTQLDLDGDLASAQVFGTPLLIGETGWQRTTSADGVGSPIPLTDAGAPREFAQAFSADADARSMGWLWFDYSSIDAAYGINYGGVLDTALVTDLAQPYPRALAGRLLSMAFDAATATYTQQAGSTFDAPSDIAVPLAWQYPGGACVYGDGQLIGDLDASGAVTSSPQAGGVFSFDTVRQTLTLQPLPAQLQIVPLGSGCAAIL